MSESQYLDLVADVMKNGAVSTDRTGTGTLSVFGRTQRWPLYRGDDKIIPLLTTKKMHARGIIEELLWFVRGCTDAKELDARGVKIWNANSSREALARMGMHDRDEGECGPIYGAQWRNWNGDGIDQLQGVIDTIRTNPDSRRMLVSAWNPSQIPDMVLPPCHVMFQFYVRDNKFLSCQMYQRSADVGLGVPYNIASYAILTHMIAQVCGLQAEEFIHVMGDTHIYSNHCAALAMQIEREPKAPFPVLRLKERGAGAEIGDFEATDFEVVGYEHWPSVPMTMAV